MKASEFKKLIREEVRRALKEGTAKYEVGQTVTDSNGDELFKVTKVYPNKAAALADIKSTVSPAIFKKIMDEVAEMYDNYQAIDSSADNLPWYVLRSLEGGQYNKYPYLNPEEYVNPE